MKISKENARKWADALRSRKYKQSTSFLQSSKGYCCLGVACDIFIPENKKRLDKGLLTGGTPKSQEHAPQWLKDVNNLTSNLIGASLIDLNDSYKYSFHEIADIIELLYVHKAIALKDIKKLKKAKPWY